MTYEANTPDPELDVKRSIEAYLAEGHEWIADAVGILSPDRDRNHDPLEIFPEPTEPRDAAPDPGLTPGQETGLREIAGRFGIGGETDVPTGADWQINEGGKPWKIEAEAAINEGATTIIFAGSPDRSEKNGDMGRDEIDYMQGKLPEGKTAATNEYDMVRQIAEMQPGFAALAQPETLPFGYDIQHGHALVHEPTGQLVKIGEIKGVPVLHLRVDRENYFDEVEGKNKFRNRPDSKELMGFISDMLSAPTELKDEGARIGLNTSTTYASRVIDAMRAGIDRDRTFSVGMYGRQTLAEIRGIAVTEPTKINHIPGEMYVMHTKLLELEAAMKEKWPS
jgi:hypothetical protein